VCERESYDSTPDLRDQIIRVLDREDVRRSRLHERRPG